MNQKKPTHPGTIVAMVVGILVAGYFIYSSLNPAPPATVPTTTAQAKKPADPAESLLDGPKTAMANTKERGDAGVRLDNVPGASAAAAPTDQAAPSRIASSQTTVRTPEAEMAPGADPFRPITIQPRAAQGGAAQQRVAAGAGSGTTGAPSTGSRPAQVVVNPTLPGMNSGASNGPLVVIPVQPKDPELVGTLLGDRPSAVFKTEKEMATASVGETFEGWKVLAVGHGATIIKKGARILRLGVGAAMASGSSIHADDSPARPATALNGREAATTENENPTASIPVETASITIEPATATTEEASSTPDAPIKLVSARELAEEQAASATAPQAVAAQVTELSPATTITTPRRHRQRHRVRRKRTSHATAYRAEATHRRHRHRIARHRRRHSPAIEVSFSGRYLPLSQ